MAIEYGKRLKELEIEGATLLGGAFKNFGGKPGRYNREGDRNIAISLDEETALRLEDEGWPVRKKEAREEGDEPLYFLAVKIKFKSQGARMDPEIWKGVSADNMVLQSEEDLFKLDNDEIENFDIVIRPWCRDDNGEWKVTLYLSQAWATIKTSRLARKYTPALHCNEYED